MSPLGLKQELLAKPPAARCVECGNVLVRNVNWLISSKTKPCHDCQIRKLVELKVDFSKFYQSLGNYLECEL